MQFCHEKHTANIQMKISEHGAFPLVSVRVWHGEPGNMHPYNFEQTSPLANYCKKPQKQPIQRLSNMTVQRVG